MKSSKSRHDFVAGAVRQIPKSGIRDFFDIVSSMPEVISLGVGEPGLQTPWHIREAAVDALEKGATGYTSNLGLADLRQSISDYVEDFFGIRYSPDNEVLVTTGVSEALDLAIRAVAEPGDEILCHEPAYVSYRPVIQLAHARPVVVETEAEFDFRLTAEALERHLTPSTKAVILNFPNNPTGAIMERRDLEKIAAVIQSRDLLVISDEIYAELTYDGQHVSLVRQPEMRDRTVLLHGLSKAWAMTGFRLGYSCAPPLLTEAMMTIHQYTMLCAPTLSQFAGVEAFRQADRDVADMLAQFRRNRNYMVKSLHQMGLPCVQPRGAFYAFPQVSDLGLSSRDFALELLEREQVAVVPGDAFGESGEGYVRCSFATSFEDIKVAMDRMNRFVSSLRDSKKVSTG